MRCVQHTLIQRLGLVMDFLDATTVPFRFHKFRQWNEMIEIEMMHFIEAFSCATCFGVSYRL